MEPAWYDATARVPRQGQLVRIVTQGGVDHAAFFEVTHTDDWPAGVAWVLENGRSSLPFDQVVLWSPDPSAVAPNRSEPPPDETPPDEAPSGPEFASEPERPAILTEALFEIEQTETVLKSLPPDQYDWTPHPDIATLRTLSRRLVRIVARMSWVLELDALEVMFEPDLPQFKTPAELIETYRSNADTVRSLIPTTTPDDLQGTWRLERDGVEIARMSRGSALRRFGIAPMVFHRGEASVMLTALGLVPPHPYPEWAFRETPTPTSAWAQP
ncbi:DinB family protein [Rubrivirga marina]|uniref:DinB-like domain-containing protein n=1 Tax=Rubrivirga marina TaxID=1196024 RepID=A0A271J0Z0_9BACT|nr:DinB family protein [Rubrivirga marina]PAP76977.1 hypothetical protein BSZ37_11310 [Rubrivirga marina]